MSTHRAEKHRGLTATFRPRPTSSTGRRRTAAPPKLGSSLSPSAMVGAAALLTAAVGAVSAGQAISATDQAAGQRNGYVVKASDPSLNERLETRVSRSGADRPGLPQDPELETAAEKLAAARDNTLHSAALNAESYAKELRSDEWVNPLAGFVVTTGFGVSGPYWASGYHTGVDITAPYGATIHSATNGVVVQSGYDGAYGNQARVQLENGDEVWYNHMSSINVSSGQTVTKGDIIGYVGATGNVSSPTAYHLHLEYRLLSDLHTAVNPVPYFAEHGVPLG